MRKMKNSGVEWIGEIPENWAVWKMKHLASEPMQYGANATGVEYNESLPRYVRITDITSNRTLSNEGKQSLPKEIAEEYILDDGDLLFARSGATAGKSFYYESKYGECAFAGYLIRFKADFQKANSKFLYYYTLTKAYEEWSQQIFIQATIQNISAEKYNGLRFAIPENIEHQNEIVEYLDKKCAEIDALIAAKEKSNALLKEQRQSIIYEAVTKGLNPDVPMKDSGIEWIGEISENAKLMRMKYVGDIFGRIGFRGYTQSDLVSEGEGPITLSPSNVGESGMDYSKCTYLSWDKYEESPEIQIKNGDILMVKTGSSYGKSAIVENLPMEATINPQFIVIKNIKCNPKYLFYYMQTELFKYQVEEVVVGGTIPTMAQEKISSFHLVIYGEKVTEEIVKYLDEKCEVINQLISSNNTTMEKLKEYRKSIIFEAVTGKVEI